MNIIRLLILACAMVFLLQAIPAYSKSTNDRPLVVVKVSPVLTIAQIKGTILSRKYYTDLLQALKTSEGTVVINITSFGGNAETGYYLYKAIKKSKAKVIINVKKYAYSAATDLVCAADEVRMEDGSSLMFHVGTVTFYNTRADIALSMLQYWDQMSREVWDNCTHILTSKDRIAIDKGADLFLLKQQLLDRKVIKD